MQDRVSPRGGDSPSAAARSSGRCHIQVLGPNRLLNELLSSFLRAETEAICQKSVGTGARKECLRIDFIDSREAGLPARLMKGSEGRASCPRQKRVVVFFNVPEDAAETVEREALAWGVRGLFYRSDSRSTIAKGIRSILAGDVWFQRGTLYRVATATATRREPADSPPEWLSLLTAREREIIARLATDPGNQEIADALRVSLHTVKTHLYRIYRKIGVRSRHQAMLWAIARGAVAVPPAAAGKHWG